MPGSMSKQEIELWMTELGVVGCKSPRAKQDGSGRESGLCHSGQSLQIMHAFDGVCSLGPSLVCGVRGTGHEGAIERSRVVRATANKSRC